MCESNRETAKAPRYAQNAKGPADCRLERNERSSQIVNWRLAIGTASMAYLRDLAVMELEY